MKPIIGVMPLVDEEKDSLWMLPGYMDGISIAGGIPVMFPLTADSEDISELLDKVDGILLTGGHDVDPTLYGEKMVCSSVIPCGRRDGMEQELLKQALGPKVGSVTLSPRGDWRMPSDASVAMWLEDLK